MLNKEQNQAVNEPIDKATLVLAGAGSGKTRVLTNRIVHLNQKYNIQPYNILAVTFTNKSAKEMKERIEQMNINASHLWIGTFHSIAYKMLKYNAKQINISDNCYIIDSTDQIKLIKNILIKLNLDIKKISPKNISYKINSFKENAIRVKDLSNPETEQERLIFNIYQEYEKECNKIGALDFCEILLKSYEALKENPDIKKYYQDKFRAVLVDEFQDTNFLQYKWLKELTNEKTSFMVVGDDDQSIYGWRGAKIENIQNFIQDFNAKTIKLEQNYRSTQNILNAANNVISNNYERLGKNLKTINSGGCKIKVFKAYNEYSEAEFVSKTICSLKSNNISILYRSNMQSRILEKLLIQYSIKYSIQGGLKFFDRSEIKDSLAYLQVFYNKNNDIALERIINVPARGIGKTSINKIKQIAQEKNISMWQTIEILSKENKNIKLRNFLNIFQKISEELTLPEIAKRLVIESGLYSMYENMEDKEEKTQKINNIKEYFKATTEYNNQENSIDNINDFLEYASLNSGENINGLSSNVTLMTIHSAKGLEFDTVFIVGLIEGIMPNQKSIEEGNINEERRLMYVAITRAKQQLFLTTYNSKTGYGKIENTKPSRFLKEISKEHLDFLN